jgi:hypothetical protein
MNRYGVGNLRNDKQERGRLEKENYEQIWSWKFEKQQTRKREIRERKGGNHKCNSYVFQKKVVE